MGCAQSKTNNENLKMSQSELHEKKGPTHLPSMSGMDSAGTTPTVEKKQGKLDLPSTSTTNGQELSTSSMITQAPLTDNSSQQPSQGTGSNSTEHSIEIETEIEIEVEIDDGPVPRNVPKMNHEVPSQSYTAHEIVTPPPSKSVQPQQRNHFKPPISRQASHSNSKSNSADPIFGAVRRQESRSRAVTDGPNFHAPELQRPSSRSDVHPAAGKYQPLAAAQAISVERAEQISKEKQQELMRKSFANAPPGETRHHHQQAQVHDSYTPAHKLSTDEVARTNPRPSISRSLTPGRSLYDPGYHTATSRPIVLDDENRQYDSTKDSYRPPKSSSVPDQPTAISRDADSLKNPRRATKKRASANWAAANFVPPPPSSAPPPEHAAMTPASHHHQQYRQSHPEASPYPSGSRTPNTGMQRAGTARTPVMYSPHHQPLTTSVPQYGPTSRQDMPRSGTYHADPRPSTQQRQMRQHQSYDIPPAPHHSSASIHALPAHPSLAAQTSYSYSSNHQPVQYGPGPSPGPQPRGPVSPTSHQPSSSHHKKKKKKKKRRLGDRGQISEKAFYEKYWIESGVLGEGSFARVRRITRKADQAPFALKLIKKRGMSVDDLTALEKEISILQKLNHPNVVQITDYCDTPKRIYMVVEYCEGGDVFSRIIQQSKFSEKDASHVIRSVTRGLEHCHANGIVHRDLKPDNLMYLTSEADSEIKIIDFGLAGDLVDGPLRTPCGTAHYVAPEVLEGTPYGCEADMWSLGVILYMLLCGFPPFFDQTGNHHRLYKIIKRGEYSFPSPYWNDVSEDAKDLIRNLLVKNSRERLTAQQALRHPWLQGDVVSDQDFSKEYLRQMSHFNSSRHFTERKLGTEENEPMHSVSLFSAEWQPPPPPH